MDQPTPSCYLGLGAYCSLCLGDYPRDPPEFMFALQSMTVVEFNSWRSGVSNAELLLKGLDYEEFNITRLLPSLTF